MSTDELSFGPLCKYLRSAVYSFITTCPSGKVLIFYNNTTAHLMKGFVGIEDSELRERGVEKQLWLEARMALDDMPNAKSYIFVVRPETKACELVRDAISNNLRALQSKNVYVYFLPYSRQNCAKPLDELKAAKGIRVDYSNSLPCPFFTIRPDLLSMEEESAFRDLFLRKRYNLLHNIVSGLDFIQSKHGGFSRVIAKGDLSREISKMLALKCEESYRPEKIERLHFDILVLIDRSIDFLTPLTVPMTYEALLDDMVGIQSGMVKIPPDGDDKNRIRLAASQELFAELENVDIRLVPSLVTSKVRAIDALMQGIRNTESTESLKQFVQNELRSVMKQKEDVSVHIDIVQYLNNELNTEIHEKLRNFVGDVLSSDDASRLGLTIIEDAIAKQHPLDYVLRLLCVLGICSGGLKPKLLTQFRHDIVCSYGPSSLLALYHLDQLGLLSDKQLIDYKTLRKMLKLWSDEATAPTDQPKDICNVCDGYGPLSVRIVQMLTGGISKSQLSNVSSYLPGAPHEERTLTFGSRSTGATGSSNLPRSSSATSISSLTRGGGGSESGAVRQTVLVCYVGGVTYSEVTAYRLLSAQEDSVADYYVCSTDVISAKRMFSNMCK